MSRSICYILRDIRLCENTLTLRLPSELADLQVGYANPVLCGYATSTVIRHPIPLPRIEKTDSYESVYPCERAVKRCVNVAKNSEKYTGKLLDKLELVS